MGRALFKDCEYHEGRSVKISNANDYRDFIKSRFDSLREANKKFSYQQAANSLGTTKSYLKLVIDKKRHMSLDKVIPLSTYFKLSPFETQCFIFLFLKNTAKNAAIKEFFSSVLASYLVIGRSDRPFPKLDDMPEYKSATHCWIQMAILELSKVKGFEANPKWIQDHLGGAKVLSLEDSQRSLDILIEKNLLIKTEDAYKSKFDMRPSSPTPLDIADFKALMLTGLKRTEIAINQKGESSLHRPNRHHTYCLQLSHDEAAEVMKLSDEFAGKVLQIAENSKNAERLMFLSSHMFAISSSEGL